MDKGSGFEIDMFIQHLLIQNYTSHPSKLLQLL